MAKFTHEKEAKTGTLNNGGELINTSSSEIIKMIPISMVEAWYFNPNSSEDPKLPHKFTPNRAVPRQHLNELGMKIWRLDADNWENNEMLEAIKQERGYNYWDIVTMAPSMSDYEEKVRHFYTEHLHADEEIRFILEGGGYWDIRDYDEQWIRFQIGKGDLVVLPPGMYHRFTLDMNNYAKAMRLFRGLPCWTQHERPSDDMEARKIYVDKVLSKDTAHYNAPEYMAATSITSPV